MSESHNDLPSTGGPLSTARALALLRESRELRPVGRLDDASNVTLLCDLDESPFRVIYKPVRGEEPLWDFPDGSLAAREVAAFEVSEALGLHVVPPTLLRDGPAGEGAVQLWIEHDGVEEAIRLVNHADEGLRPIALFDAIVNNSDRKAGHLLPIARSSSAAQPPPIARIGNVGDQAVGTAARRILGVDHGVTFAVEPKLRTVLWHWRSEAFTEGERSVLERAASLLDEKAPLTKRLAALITAKEVDALRARIRALIEAGIFPEPSNEWPPLPWPLV